MRVIIKFWLVFSLFFIASGLILTKLFYLQIKNGQYYEALALGQQIVFKEAESERGAIYSFNNKVLAQTFERSVVYILPNKIEQKEETANVLAEIFKEKPEDLFLKINENIIFKKEISEEQFVKVKALHLAGVVVDTLLSRAYPFSDFASHALGFVNQEGQGQYGVEGYYNEVIEGGALFQAKALSPDFLFLFLKDNLSGKKGPSSLVLTLDYNLQYLAEKLLKEAKEQWNFDKAQIIILNPTNGKILTMAISPSFDPNNFFEVKEPNTFLNPALQELFEPGSVFKPITMAAGIEECLVKAKTEYEDTGKVELGGPPIYNFDKRIWGKQTMTDVLEESINTGAVFVEQKLGKDKFLKYVDSFGFFELTGVDLAGEVSSKNEGLKKGYPRDFASASFGQGIMMTSLQLMRAFSAIANGGKLVQPQIVEKIIYSNGEEKVIEPKLGEQVISKATSIELTAMLVSVIKNGAGRKATVPNYYLAGKTGTAQVPLKTGGYDPEKTIQSFIGYFPALNPKFLVFIRLDNPKQANAASSSAAPIFHEIAKYALDLYQIPPDY
ncbi:penicillin-binding protein 2 [Candidatus Parcubacteria bacterium]|nr:penicillin-binding protein 2 [Candidatus Parcubacteria bacterium]